MVTNLTPDDTQNLTIESSLRNSKGKFTPNGLSVSFDITFISFLQLSISPDEVSIIPNPPASHTADASLLLAIHPIGACIIGYFEPVCFITLLLIIISKN